MDILKKMFGMGKEEGKSDSGERFKDEFKKPSWFEEEYESDDELFDSNRKFIFQMFTNPLELQKYFEQQMQEILKSIRENEENGENFDRDFKDEYLKPGFEEKIMKEFKKNMKSMDTDLDGEIYADQLHSLLQRISPDIKAALSDKKKNQNLNKTSKPKLSDEEKIMAIIHGTLDTEENSKPIKRKEIIVPKIPPHFGGVFEGTYQGPKMFRQSIMSQTIRKPDGSYETKKIIRDTDGNIKTTITRTIDGKTETVTTYDKEGSTDQKSLTIQKDIEKNIINVPAIPSDRNIYVTTNGYALPKNMW